ncbi:MAG TPA: DoxX family protein [Puia sp.]|nr:DoxX family protein [Puia sp.]
MIQPHTPTNRYSNENAEVVFLLLRLWFGYTMMSNGTSIFDKSNEAFFLDWFGKQLHFPYPILMFYLAKGSEFFGGLLLFFGFATRIAGSFVAFTMIVATLTANRHHIYSGDGSITISFFLFAIIFIYMSAGKWSIDNRLFKLKQHFPEFPVMIIRFWFASLLLYAGFNFAVHDGLNMIFSWLSGKIGLQSNNFLIYLGRGIEIICGVLILIGLFTRIATGVIAAIMIIIKLIADLGLLDIGNANPAYAAIFFWFAVLLFFFATRKWTARELVFSRMPGIKINKA